MQSQPTRTGRLPMTSRATSASEIAKRVPRKQRAGIGVLTARKVIAYAVATLALSFSLGSSQLYAQADHVRPGTRVVQKTRDFAVRHNDGPSPQGLGWLFIYDVERVDGPKLWIKAEAERYRGRVMSDQVIPVDQALEFFTEQIRTKPRDAFAYALRATVWLDKREFDRAVADFTEAIRIDPKCAAAFVGRASLAVERPQTGESHRRLHTSHPTGARLVSRVYRRGRLWLQRLEYDEAIADFTAAIRVDPNCVEAYESRATTWHRKLDDEKAITDLAVVVRLAPENLEAQARLTRLRRSPGHAATGDGGKGIYKKGTSEGKKQQYDKAVDDLVARTDSLPKTRRLTIAGAWLRTKIRSMTRRSPCLAWSSGSIPGMPMPTAVGGSPGWPKTTTTRPSLTSIKPSRSAPMMPCSLPTAPGPGLTRGSGKPHPRLYRGDPAR